MLDNIFLENLFSSVVKMSLTASYVIIFVVIVRFFMKNLPKIYSYALWSVVLFRLICPFSFESSYSLVPTYQESIRVEGVENQANQANQEFMYTTNDATPEVAVSLTILDVVINYLKFIWIFGVFFILGYNFVSMAKLKSKLNDKTHYYDNIYHCEMLQTAFVLGLVNPKIYLPTNLSEKEQEFILLHEQTHIKRFDNITSFISFVTLTIHWFNPLVWIAFSLANKDMEMSCDEVVIRKLSCKKEYSQSLLSFAVGNRKLISPLAFSEGSVNDTKQRIKNIVSYEKPTIFIAIISICVVAFIILGLGSDSTISLKNIDGIALTDYGKQLKNYNLNISSNDNTILNNAKITVSMDTNSLAGIIPSTGDFNSSIESFPIRINSAGSYKYSVYDVRDNLSEGYNLNFIINLGEPFSITTPSTTEPIYSRNGIIYTDSNTLGFNVNDLNFDIMINRELTELQPWENISDYTIMDIDTDKIEVTTNPYYADHLEVTVNQIDDVTREIITYNTITGETTILSVSSPPGFEIPV